MLLALQLPSARKPIVKDTTTSMRITMEPPQPQSQEVLVHRSSTRRKACTRCVKAKRRCNLTLPACSRCRTRSLDCVYVDATGAAASSPLTANDSGVAFSTPPGLEESSQSSSYLALEDLEITNFNPLYSFPFPELGTISTSQLNFCVSKLKSCVSSLVLENRTLFMHPKILNIEIPEIYQDALSVCSLYMHKTTQNAGAVFQVLDSKVNYLVTASTFLPCDILRNLFALQALLIYQIIRVFDGDPRQRAYAERDFDLLDSWTLRLHANYFEAEQASTHLRNHPRWIVLESIRRTVMVSVLLRDLYGAMKENVLTLVPLISQLPVSTNNGLWKRTEDSDTEDEAVSEVIFTYGEFTQKWNEGCVTGIDDYGKTLLVACRHANGTRHFREE